MLEDNKLSEQGSKTRKGLVKWFCDHKGYGFLKEIDAEGDIFAHHSEIILDQGFKKLRKGQTVSFELFFDLNQKKARNIFIIP
ncbi:MAG: CspA family cold shock protein [Colwellia sp.]|jgi:CspA family cold shock protein